MLVKICNYTTIVGILRSGGDTLFGLAVDTASVWLVGVPLSFIGAKLLGFPIYAVVLFAYCEEFAKFIFCLKRVFTNKWARNLVSTDVR